MQSQISELKVVLIGNYANDKIRSMEIYAATLYEQLKEFGINVSLVIPNAYFGRLYAGPTGLGKWLGYIDKFLIFPFHLKKLSKKNPSGIFHICDQSNAHFIHYLPKDRTIVTVHDLMAIQAARGDFQNIKIGWTGKILQKTILNGLHKFAYFICVSEATKAILENKTLNCSSNIKVIPNALVQSLGNDTSLESTHIEIDNHHINTPYLLNVGNDNWYKNRDGLFDIFAEIHKHRPDLHLILVGPPLNETQKSRLPQGVIHKISNVSNIDNRSLSILYQNAEMLLFPSIMEGFGWPILEALSLGCPVSVIQIPPMTEIAGTHGLYLNHPKEFSNHITWVKDCCSKISIYLTDQNRNSDTLKKKRQQQSQKFSPEAIFPQYVKLYSEVISKSQI